LWLFGSLPLFTLHPHARGVSIILAACTTRVGGGGHCQGHGVSGIVVQGGRVSQGLPAVPGSSSVTVPAVAEVDRVAGCVHCSWTSPVALPPLGPIHPLSYV